MDLKFIAICILAYDTVVVYGLARGRSMNVDTRFFQLLHEKRSVTDVCVRAQGISHFYYVYFFAKITQNGSKFAAYQTASENDDLLTNLVCLEVVILGYYHFAALSKTRDRRHSRGTPPTMRTFLFTGAGCISPRPSSSLPIKGLTVQRRVNVLARSVMQVKQRRKNICWIIPGGRKITMMRSRSFWIIIVESASGDWL